MRYMFKNCSLLVLDCSSWNVSQVTSSSFFDKNAPGVIKPSFPSSGGTSMNPTT